MAFGAGYIESPEKEYSRKTSISMKGFLASIFMVAAIALGFIAVAPAVTSAAGVPVASNAVAAWCASPKNGEIGYGMNIPNSWYSSLAKYPHVDSARTLTAQEAYGAGVRFVNFHGTGKGGSTFLFAATDDGLPTVSDNDDFLSVVSVTGKTPKHENWESNLNNSRVASNCLFGDLGTGVANFILGGANMVVALTGAVANLAFDPGFICKKGDTSNCVDLVRIIGGTGAAGDSGGIIGQLATSIYFPLLVVVSILMGIWLIKNGVLKRRFRDSLMGAGYFVLVLFIGVAVLSKPEFLARAPMVVSNTLTSCIVGTFTGSGSCGETVGEFTDDAAYQSNICIARGGNDNNPIEQAPLTMAGMTCELWKSFVMQPYAQAAFGAPLQELDTQVNGTVARKIIDANPDFKPDDFCVGTRTNGKLEDFAGKTLELTASDNSKICNLAIYQIALGTDVKTIDTDGGAEPNKPNTIDHRWLKIAQFAASDDGMYRAWSGGDAHFGKVNLAMIGLLSAILASVVIFVTSAFALAFYVTSILIMAFSPFFLLVGLIPGKGRNLLFGWLGQALSSLMKYIVSAVFLVITVILYSTVLSNVSNLGATLIFVLILTFALLMYRREIVEMFGVIDLGGQKMSNRFASAIESRVGNVKKTALAASAGVTAGVLSNGVVNPFSKEARGDGNFFQQVGNSFGSVTKHAMNGGSAALSAGMDATRRSIKSRPGAFSEVLKASDRISSDNKHDLAILRNNVNEEVRDRTLDLQNAQRDFEKTEREIVDINQERDSKVALVEEAKTKAQNVEFGVNSRHEEVQAAHLAGLANVSNPHAKELHDLLHEMKNLEIKAQIARASGDESTADEFNAARAALNNKQEELLKNVSQEELENSRKEYHAAVANAVADPRVNTENIEKYMAHTLKQFESNAKVLAGADYQVEKIKSEVESRLQELESKLSEQATEVTKAEVSLENAQAAKATADSFVSNLGPGQVLSNRKTREVQEIVSNKLNGVNPEKGQQNGEES